MVYARNNGYTILTNDLDFGALLAHTQAHGPSVILIRAGILIPQIIGQTIVTILREHRAVIETGALVTVDEYRHKLIDKTHKSRTNSLLFFCVRMCDFYMVCLLGCYPSNEE